MDWQRGKIPYFVPPPNTDVVMEETKTEDKISNVMN
jgi:hypothetical protein